MKQGVNHQDIIIINIYSIKQFWQYALSSNEDIKSENIKLAEREEKRASECPAGMYHAFDVDTQDINQTQALLEKRFAHLAKSEKPPVPDFFPPAKNKVVETTKNKPSEKPKHK
jgi:hypothetical protein